MLGNMALFGVGLVALYYGADWLVGGSARLARRLGVGPLIVGLTIVAFGTSAPELFVGVVGSVGGESALVLGNVVGSNILNIALIIGVSALVRPLHVGLRLLARETPLMVVVSIATVVMMLDETVSRTDGSILVVAFLGFLWFVLRAAKEEPREVTAQYVEFEQAEHGASAGTLRRDVALVLFGLGALILGAQFLVSSSLYFARLLGISEVVIGLTIVALGTSLPELATRVVAAARSESDIALGNAIGSNIFNLLAILGISALILPITVDAALLEFEVPVMVAAAILVAPLAWRGKVLGRWAGGILVAGYVAFTLVLIARSL